MSEIIPATSANPGFSAFQRLSPGLGGAAIRTLQFILSVFLLFLLWWAVAASKVVSEGLLPSPFVVFDSLYREFSDFYARYVIATVWKTLQGAFWGIGLGLAVGLVLGYSRWLRIILEPMLTLFQSFPREALYPLLVVAIGVGSLPQIINAALLSFFPIAVTTLNGLLDTRKDYVALVQSWGAKKHEEFLFCRLPYMIPSLVSALRLALPFALIGAVLAEMLGGGTSPGLGNLINSASAGQNARTMYAAIVLLATIGMSMIAALNIFEGLLLKRFRHG